MGSPSTPSPPPALGHRGPSTHLLLPGFRTFLQQPRAAFPGTVLILTVIYKCPEAAERTRLRIGRLAPAHCPKINPLTKPQALLKKFGAVLRHTGHYQPYLTEEETEAWRKQVAYPMTCPPQSLQSYTLAAHPAQAHLSLSCFCSST